MSQLAYEPDPLELFALLPELTLEDVKARLAYARAAIVTSAGSGDLFGVPLRLRRTRLGFSEGHPRTPGLTAH